MRHFALGIALSIALVTTGCEGRLGASGPPVLNGDTGRFDGGAGATDTGTGGADDAPAVDAYVGPDAYVAPDLAPAYGRATFTSTPMT